MSPNHERRPGAGRKGTFAAVIDPGRRAGAVAGGGGVAMGARGCGNGSSRPAGGGAACKLAMVRGPPSEGGSGMVPGGGTGIEYWVGGRSPELPPRVALGGGPDGGDGSGRRWPPAGARTAAAPSERTEGGRGRACAGSGRPGPPATGPANQSTPSGSGAAGTGGGACAARAAAPRAGPGGDGSSTAAGEVSLMSPSK